MAFELNIDPLTAYIFLSLFALAIGSLLNVIIYRLPIMLQQEWTVQCRELLAMPESKAPTIQKMNLFWPRSFCPKCQTTIPFWHNIPLLSYFLLRGRCRECQHAIPFRYPLVEGLSLALSLIAATHFGWNLTLVFVLLFIWLNLCIIFIDLEHQLIPDSLSLSLLWLGLIANTQDLFINLPNAVLTTAAAYLFLWLFIQIFYLLTGKVGMGHGDFKLFAAFAAWLGWTQLPLILLISSITGAIIGIVYLKLTSQSRQTPIPFGPFLSIAGLISLFVGQDIIHWYISLF